MDPQWNVEPDYDTFIEMILLAIQNDRVQEEFKKFILEVIAEDRYDRSPDRQED